MDFKLYKHQKDENKVLRTKRKTLDHILFGASVGYGKSVALWDMIGRDLRKGLRVLVLAPRRSLVFQLEETFVKYAPHVLMGSVDRGDPDSGLILSSIQTTNSKLKHDSTMYNNIDVIYIDEVHIGCNFPPKKGTLFDLLYKKYWNTCKWVGLSATPITAEGYRLTGWDETMYKYQTGTLIDMGYLADFVYKIPATIDTSQMRVNKVTNEYDVSDVESAVMDSATIKSVKKQLLEHYFDHTKALIFCITIDHAELLAEAIGEHVFIIHSKMPEAKQRKMLADFKLCDTAVMINVAMLTTGFDDPTVNLLIIARPIRSVRLAIQVWGRGLRKYGDKVCTILDMGSVYDNCGLPDDIRDFNKVKPAVAQRLEAVIKNGKECMLCTEVSPVPEWRVKRKVKKRCIIAKWRCPACGESEEKRQDFKKVSGLREIMSGRRILKGLEEASVGIKTLTYRERKPLVKELVVDNIRVNPNMSHYVVTETNKAKCGKMMDYVLLNYKKNNISSHDAWRAVDKIWKHAKGVLSEKV